MNVMNTASPSSHRNSKCLLD